MRSLLVASLVLALALLAAHTHAAVCTGGGYDFSSLTYSDYIYQDVGGNNDTYYFRPCSNVTAVACAGDPAMLCQVDPWGEIYRLAVWYADSPALTTWTPIDVHGAKGLRMQLTDGELCGDRPRSLTINWICDASLGAQQARFASLNETSICVYEATIYQAVTCPGLTQTCGAYGYDLTSLSSADLVWTDTAGNYTYYYRPCGTVTSAQCAQNPNGGVAGEAMMCQAVGTHNEIADAYDIAVWNPSLATWTRSSGNGNGGNGQGRTLSMTIEDGASCGGVARALTVNYICSQSATTPIFHRVIETATCVYVAYVNTSVVCGNPAPNSQPVACGGIYDLSLLSTRDISYSSNGYNFIFRPCSTVADIQCSRNAAANTSMLCQAVQNSNTAYSLAVWDVASVQWYPTLSGVRMDLQDGAYCGAIDANRKVEIHFICGRSPLATFINFTEVSTCKYVGYVSTSLVCSGQRDGYCGAQSYDFSLASTSNDLIYNDGDYKWIFRPCGQVIDTVCNDDPDTANSMLCQDVLGTPYTYNVAFYDSNLVYWNRITNGMQMFVQDGATCNDVPRALTMNFICAPTLTQAVFANITEVSVCSYVGFVLTPQACTQTSSTGLMNIISTGGTGIYDFEDPSHCGGPYDLSSLSTTDLIYDDVAMNYTWIMRPCGKVSYAACVANTDTNGAMMCQVRDQSDHTTYDIAVYKPELVTYAPSRTGVNMTLADGAMCSATLTRMLTVMFTCDTSATTASLVSVIEVSSCIYVARVMTSLVCPRTGVSCGGAGYDLTALTTRGDLYLADDGAANHWYFAPCGTVQNSQCAKSPSTESAMMCQVTQYNRTFNVATYIPQDITWTAITNGVQMSVQDGATCDGYDYERKLIVNFLCSSGGAYQFVSVVEFPRCQYTATINTGLACSDIADKSGSGSSASLSGGAIAGIVIGTVAGALIILAVILVVCCGMGGLRLASKKSSTDDGPKASGRFDQMEASEVEMNANDTHDNDNEGETA